MYLTFPTPKSSLIPLGVLIVKGLDHGMTKDESSDVGQGNSCLAQGSDFKTAIVAIFYVLLCVFLPIKCYLPMCLCIAVVGTVPGLGLLILG